MSAALADALSKLYEDIAKEINKGINGTLTNVEAAALKIDAKQMFGIDLDFTKTAQGLKLSSDNAISLYNALSKTDSVAAKLTFDELTKSLTKAGEACEDITKTMASIQSIQKEINKLENEGLDANDGKIIALKQQRDLYKEIADIQMDNPDSYAFMDKKLPGYL
jgi:hypothetical protein